MAGKPNTKWIETMIVKHGSREAVREVQRAIGAKGGSVKNTKTPKGFAANRELARTAGAKGGRNSRRGKGLPKVNIGGHNASYEDLN